MTKTINTKKSIRKSYEGDGPSKKHGGVTKMKMSVAEKVFAIIALVLVALFVTVEAMFYIDTNWIIDDGELIARCLFAGAGTVFVWAFFIDFAVERILKLA